MKFYRSDWLGVILGIILGAYQFFVLLNKPLFSNFNGNNLIIVIAFGLIGPPILALITKFFITYHSKFNEKLGKYINTYFMIITFGLSTGISGFIYHLIIGLPSNTLMPILFFSSAAFGFLIAYFIYPQIAYRPNEKA